MSFAEIQSAAGRSPAGGFAGELRGPFHLVRTAGGRVAWPGDGFAWPIGDYQDRLWPPGPGKPAGKVTARLAARLSGRRPRCPRGWLIPIILFRASSAPPRDRQHSASATPGLAGRRCRPAGHSTAQPGLSLLEAGEPSREFRCANRFLAAFRSGDRGKPSAPHLARSRKTCHWALAPGTNGPILLGT